MSPQSKIVLLALVSIACLSYCHADVIEDVCGIAASPPTCKKLLQSDPKLRAAKDVESLGFAVIDKAIGFANSAKAAAASAKMKSCAGHFNDAISSLNECKEALKSKDRFSLNIKASAAYTNAATCNEDGEHEGPKSVQEATRNLIDTCSALLALSNRL